MDLVAGARNLIVMMEHLDRQGNPKLVQKCDYPLTGLACVNIVLTDLGLFRFVDGGWVLDEITPGFTVDEVVGLTGFPVTVSPNLR
jgi:3-oxoacid CoA-transferase B subunit